MTAIDATREEYNNRRGRLQKTVRRLSMECDDAADALLTRHDSHEKVIRSALRIASKLEDLAVLADAAQLALRNAEEQP